MSRKLTTPEFIERIRPIHGDRYVYTKAVYLGNSKPIEVICLEHGSFFPLPMNHLKGGGCSKCGHQAQGSSRRLSQDEFIRRAEKAHGVGTYGYTRVVYRGNGKKVEIICPVHGPFQQRAGNHLAGVGCNQCADLGKGNRFRRTAEDFIILAGIRHENKYDYSRVEYRGAFEYVEVLCPTHGPFQQTPDAHLNAGAGCPRCSHRYSQPHQEIEEYLGTLNIPLVSNSRSVIPPLELDIYLPEHRVAIEFNGTYWHSLDGTESPGPGLKNRHLDKFRACHERGITLLQIDEHEWNDPAKREIWKSIIGSKTGKHSRIMARKTSFNPIPPVEAQAFLDANHLQGSTPAIRWSFGLRHDGDMVGVITFSGHEKTHLNLTRLAFLRNTTVVGGAQKLFKGALALLPALDIVTFSNNQYSGGGVYPLLGFGKVMDLPPSYQWLFRNQVWNKRRLRHKYLPTILGVHYDPGLTEHRNLYRSGARCLYDAGYQKWAFRR